MIHILLRGGSRKIGARVSRITKEVVEGVLSLPPPPPFPSRVFLYSFLQCAQISKHAGGIGLSIHHVRAANSYIRGTNGSSNGIVPMLRVFNNTARYVDQVRGFKTHISYACSLCVFLFSKTITFFCFFQN